MCHAYIMRKCHALVKRNILIECMTHRNSLCEGNKEMEINKLKILLKVIAQGNMTKASEDISYSQSGISHVVKALERDFGFPLLVRNRIGVEATEDCKRVLPAIQQIIYWNEQLEQIAASVKGVTIGKVRIGTFTSMSVHWLPKIIKLFQSQYPNVEIELVEGGDQSLADGIENGLIDIGFGRKPVEMQTDWLPLFEDCLMAVLPAGSFEGKAFPIKHFHHAPFIALPEYFDHEVADIFQEAGIVPDIKFSSTDDYTIISMVEQGVGISVLPQMVLQGYKHCHIQAISLDPYHQRQLGIVLPSMNSASPATRKFIECTQEVIRTAL